MVCLGFAMLIKIDHNIDVVMAKLSGQQRQVSYAAAVALTRTAAAIKAALPAELDRVLDQVGRIAAQRLIDKDFRVTRQHGEFIDKNGTLFMGTYHPAAILRNPNNKEAAFGDWLKVRDKIEELHLNV